MNNSPFTLKTHKYCSFERTPDYDVKERIVDFRATRCNTPIADNAPFCTEHAYAQQLLDLAAERGYPEMQPVKVDLITKEPCGVIIGRGVGSWRSYAERVNTGHAKVMVHRLMKIKPVRKGVA